MRRRAVTVITTSAGTAGSSAGSGGKAGSGTSGSAGAGGGGSSCTPASGTTCSTAVEYEDGCSYAPGDRVLATCKVGTAGCIQNREMLFQCVSACDTQDPGTITNTARWTIADQCNQN